MITDPLTDHDVVHGHRMLAMVARKEGNVEEARRALDEALAALDARPELESLFPWTRPMIIMDQADLAAFGTGDREEAIRLYDQVLARRDAATPRDCWIAAQNAAMFTAQAGRYAEATRRVDDMLASTPPGVIPEVDLIAVRAAQSNWPAQAGDLPGAYERSLAFWNEYKDRDDAAVLRVGVRLAQWHPVPQQCETRLAIARMLLNKINALRANPSSNPAAPSELQLDDLETQTLTIIANSEGCADGALIAWARMRLGLPPHQP